MDWLGAGCVSHPNTQITSVDFPWFFGLVRSFSDWAFVETAGIEVKLCFTMFCRCKYWRLCQSLTFFGGSLNINWPKEIVWKAVSKWGIHWYIFQTDQPIRFASQQETMQIFGNLSIWQTAIWFDLTDQNLIFWKFHHPLQESCLYGCRLKNFSVLFLHGSPPSCG